MQRSKPRTTSALFFILWVFTRLSVPVGSIDFMSASSFHNFSPSLGNHSLFVQCHLYYMMGHSLSSTKNLYCLPCEWPINFFFLSPIYGQKNALKLGTSSMRCGMNGASSISIWIGIWNSFQHSTWVQYFQSCFQRPKPTPSTPF